MLGFLGPLFVTCVVLLVIAIVIVTVFRAPSKMKVRFSLRSLMFFVLWGGGCATLLQDSTKQWQFIYGIVGTMLFFAFLISRVIEEPSG
jgi:hypothetical protein